MRNRLKQAQSTYSNRTCAISLFPASNSSLVVHLHSLPCEVYRFCHEVCACFSNPCPVWCPQVLFSIVSLGIPDALLSGPATAAELAATIGHKTNADWLDRLLSAAAVMGMLKRARISQAAAQQRTAAAKGTVGSAACLLRLMYCCQ
jgi:hypothetical protein